MNKTLALTAFVMFAVAMGMSAMAPAMAVSPPAEGPGAGHVPSVDVCEKIAALEGISEAERANLLEKAGCLD